MVGEVKKPGTYKKVKVISGVVGQGGGIFQTDALGQPISVAYGQEYNTGAGNMEVSANTQLAPISTYSPVEQKSGLEGLSQKIRNQLGIANLKKSRSGGSFDLTNELKIGALASYDIAVSSILGIKQLPQTAKAIFKNPMILKEIPGQIQRSAEEFGRTLKTSPTEAIARVGTEILLLKGSSKAIKVFEKLSETQLTKLSLKYVGKAKTGDELLIKTASGKNVKLKIVKSTPKETFLNQVTKAGKEINAISSQADKLLTRFFNRSRIIRKPIPNEETLSKAIKTQLKKFDTGRLNYKQIIKLNRDIIKTGRKGLLERSFFADPNLRVRPSRLGVLQKEKPLKFIDYLTEDITFRRNKPQVLFFENIKIQKFPAKIQKGIDKIITSKAARSLKETRLRQFINKNRNEIINFQLKKSGKFKPLGFLTRESEISLSPKDLIKRVKKIGVTIAKGRKVDIIQAKPYKASMQVNNLFKKLNSRKITIPEVRKLDKLLKKETGFNYGISNYLSSYGKNLRRYVNLKPISLSLLSKLSRGVQSKVKSLPGKSVYTVSKSYKPSYIKTPKKSSYYSTPTSRTSRTPGKPYKPTIRPPARPPIKPPIRPPKILPPGAILFNQPLKNKKNKGKYDGYFIYEKRAGKFARLNKIPLSYSDAKDNLAYRVDNKLSRTMRLVKVTGLKSLGNIPRNIKGYYSATKKQLRESIIRKGKGIKTPNQFIEKNPYILNRRGERQQLSLNKKIKRR
jgi:hypothetical protein